jgi:hypothetical protein
MLLEHNSLLQLLFWWFAVVSRGDRQKGVASFASHHITTTPYHATNTPYHRNHVCGEELGSESPTHHRTSPEDRVVIVDETVDVCGGEEAQACVAASTQVKRAESGGTQNKNTIPKSVTATTL